jgi:hypothetical protein
MSKSIENPQTAEKEEAEQRNCHLETDPRTGLPILVGPRFTKEDIARDFPDDSDRDSHILRRSVGL